MHSLHLLHLHFVTNDDNLLVSRLRSFFSMRHKTGVTDGMTHTTCMHKQHAITVHVRKVKSLNLGHSFGFGCLTLEGELTIKPRVLLQQEFNGTHIPCALLHEFEMCTCV